LVFRREYVQQNDHIKNKEKGQNVNPDTMETPLTSVAMHLFSIVKKQYTSLIFTFNLLCDN